MIFPTPPQYRKRRRSKHTGEAPTPSGLRIVSVQTTATDTEIKVFFSAPIAWNGVDVPTAFTVFTHDGFFDSPVDVQAVGTDWMLLEFNGGIDAGAAWRLDGAMIGITPAVAFPQDGVVS